MLIKSRVVIGTAVTAIALLTLAACSPKDADKAGTPTATKAAPASSETIAATVNGTPITQKEVDVILKQQRGMPDTPETRKMIIDNLALAILAAQEAVKKGLDKSPEIQSEFELAKQNVLAQAYVQDFIKNATITDAQITAEYEKLKAQATPAAGEKQYKARHILVKDEAEAKAIIAKLNKNVKAFDQLAKEKSIDPGSKDKGGDLGWFDTKTMVPEFSAAVAKLEKGKFTETPVKSQFGYHVIILDDTRPAPASNTNIPPLEQIKASLTQQMQQQNLKKALDDMKAKAKIEIVGAAAPASHATTPAAPAAAEAPAPAATPAAPAAAEPAKK